MNFEDMYNALLQYMGEENVRHMHEVTVMRVNYDNLKRSRDAILKQSADLQEKYNEALRRLGETNTTAVQVQE